MNFRGNSMNLCIFDHFLNLKNYTAWTSWEVGNYVKYKFLNIKNQLCSCSVNFDFDWKSIYLLLRMVTVDTKLRVFQYKIWNNIRFVKEMLFKFRKVESPLCSFCKAEDETYIPLFYRCRNTSLVSWMML